MASTANLHTGTRGKRWHLDPSELPWFEQPNAYGHIDEVAKRWKLNANGKNYLKKWIEDGYFIVDNLIPEDLIARFSDRIDAIWEAKTPVSGLTISDVRVDDHLHVSISHADLLQIPLAERLAAKQNSNWRICGYHGVEPSALEIFELQDARNLCSAIFDRPAAPHFSLTFSKGSEQFLHQDSCVFHVWPPQFLAGVWIACEDISESSGPLVYYPGSHQEPMFTAFDNYPQTQRRTATPQVCEGYDQFVVDTATKYTRKLFLPKRGTALFWHGMLIHGGSPVIDPSSTRKSVVIHYLPPGTNREADIEGPFNW